MESTTEITSIVREIEIDASPETVWQFFVDPERATRWMGQIATLDPRPGGEYRVDVIPGHTASGEFVELDPPQRLVQTWGWEPGKDGPSSVPPGSSTIEIELVPDGRGRRWRCRPGSLAERRDVDRRSCAAAGLCRGRALSYCRPQCRSRRRSSTPRCSRGPGPAATPIPPST